VLGPLLALAAVVVVAGLMVAGAERAVPNRAIGVLRTRDFHILAFSPGDPNVVFFGHHDGIMRSDDGGRTWRPLVEQRSFDAMGLAVNPTNPRQVFVAGHDILQVSAEGGSTWQPVAHNLPGTDIHGFAMSQDDPSRLYAFVVGHGLFRSDDEGRSWTMRSDHLPGDVMALATAGGTPETVYAGSMRLGVLKSADGGKTWVPSNAGLGSTSVMALAVHPINRQVLFVGTEDGLYRSDDAAASWRKLPFPGEHAVALAVSPSSPEVVMAIEFVRPGEGLVYRSDDSGQTWGEGR
jgi:photosystem II stability/assembly factor-like uncharacterized protein